VTYTVEVSTDNHDGKLLPYLTANVKFKTGFRQDVLLVPNASLRWTPRPGQIAPDTRQSPRPHSGSRRKEDASGTVRERSVIWVAQGGFVRPVHVRTGLSDGAMTEVEAKDLSEGMPVVVGENVREVQTGQGAERSPFTPQLGRGLRQSQSGQAGSGGDR
jgi:HlyD family secretion protein